MDRQKENIFLLRSRQFGWKVAVELGIGLGAGVNFATNIAKSDEQALILTIPVALAAVCLMKTVEQLAFLPIQLSTIITRLKYNHNEGTCEFTSRETHDTAKILEMNPKIFEVSDECPDDDFIQSMHLYNVCHLLGIIPIVLNTTNEHPCKKPNLLKIALGGFGDSGIKDVTRIQENVDSDLLNNGAGIS